MNYLPIREFRLTLYETNKHSIFHFTEFSTYFMFRQWKPTVKTNVVAETCAAIKYSLRGKQRGAKRSPLEDIVGLI